MIQKLGPHNPNKSDPRGVKMLGYDMVPWIEGWESIQTKEKWDP